MTRPTIATQRVEIRHGVDLIAAVCKEGIFHSISAEWRWVLPAVLGLSAIGVELVSTYIMGLISGFYYTISSRDSSGFFSLLVQSLLVISALSLVAATRQFATDACALQWREDLVLRLHGRYFKPCFAYDITHTNSIDERTGGQQAVDNPDQRIQQDCERFSSSLAQMLAALLPIPGVLLYYTWHLWKVFGWIAPLSCYAYFAISTYICSSFAKVLIPIVSDQDKKEGDFRFRHARYLQRVEAVSLLRGEMAEHLRINRSFAEVCSNMRQLVVRRLPLHFWVTWFGYMGSVVNYAVVGFTILVVMQSNDFTPSELASLLSSGSYACLYLIGTFSTLLGMSQEFSQLCGYSSRLVELIQFQSGRDSMLPWLSYENHSEDVDNIDDASALPGGCLSSWINAIGWETWIREPQGYSSLPVTSEEHTGRCLDEPLEVSIEMSRKSSNSLQMSLGGGVIMSIQHLSVACPRGAGFLIKDLCLELSIGCKLIITGGSGQGKTTLFRVLAGLVQPFVGMQPGIGGTECVRFKCKESDILFLPQDPYFTEGTLANNISYPHPSNQKTRLAADAMIAQLQSGQQTGPLGNGNDRICFGESLSPGELQRVAIARAVYRRPTLIFLDEATSALDELTEDMLMTDLAEKCGTIAIGARY